MNADWHTLSVQFQFQKNVVEAFLVLSVSHLFNLAPGDQVWGWKYWL